MEIDLIRFRKRKFKVLLNFTYMIEMFSFNPLRALNNFIYFIHKNIYRNSHDFHAICCFDRKGRHGFELVIHMRGIELLDKSKDYLVVS